MNVLTNLVSVVLISLFFCVKINAQNTQQDTKPNIILIMADDLGYGDIGPYNDEIDFTPNIDRLAEEGMRFTDFHSNGPMCSPTRAALMTGMYQHRLGERFEGALNSKTLDEGLPLQAITIAEILKDAGYITGIFGKWHLGFEKPFIPTNYGFDEFRGHLSGDGDYHTHINRWGLKDWWDNDDLEMVEGYNTNLITEYSLEFINRHKEESFFLYVPYLAIHFPWQGPEDPPHRKAGETYGIDKWGIIERQDNVRPHVVSMIRSLDQGVGQIFDKINELNLENNTLIIFTSDNGGYTNYYQHGNRFENISDNGPLKGQKTDVYEGGHRVPFIAYWPGKIKSGTENDETVVTMDLFPTFSDLSGAKLPNNYKIDGISILPTLLESKKLTERTFYWKIGRKWAVREGPWKLVNESNGSRSLFNLNHDIGEETDLSKDNPLIVKELTYQYQVWKREVESDTNIWE